MTDVIDAGLYVLWYNDRGGKTCIRDSCYRHFVTDSIMDKGGLEFDWKADMEGTWVCGESDFENCTVTIRSGRLLLMRGKKTLYDGRYLLNEDTARLVPEDVYKRQD